MKIYRGFIGGYLHNSVAHEFCRKMSERDKYALMDIAEAEHGIIFKDTKKSFFSLGNLNVCIDIKYNEFGVFSSNRGIGISVDDDHLHERFIREYFDSEELSDFIIEEYRYVTIIERDFGKDTSLAKECIQILEGLN